MHEQASIPTPACPRCGYELQGVVAAWRDECPLDGRCSECGLALDWRDVLNPRYHAPGWCVEAGPTWAIPLRLVRTLWMLLRPWAFWSAIRMQFPVRWLRLAIVALVPAAMVYMTLCVAVGVSMYRLQQPGRRAAAGLPPASALAQGIAAAAWPFSSSRAWGPIERPRALAQRYDILPPQATWRVIRVGVDGGVPPDTLFVISEHAAIAVATVLLCPVGMGLLPISRRRARVRWRHIARLALYSLVFAAVPLSVDCWNQVAGLRGVRPGHVAIALVASMSAALWIWWAAATARYLHIRHAWAVGGLVVVFAHVLRVVGVEALQWLTWNW